MYGLESGKLLIILTLMRWRRRDKLKEWKRIRCFRTLRELVAIGIFLGIIAICIYYEVVFKKGISLFGDAKLDDISLAILQIQATVMTLSLTIITILSGSIADSYMGVAISEYYLEKRPVLFKQRCIIIIEFVCLICSVFFHIITKDSLVIACFLISVGLILISVAEVYSSFKGKNHTSNEIELYVRYLFEEDEKYQNTGKSFLKDWKAIVEKQSLEEFNQYFNLFIILVKRCIRQSDIRFANSLSEEMSIFLLQHEKESCKIKGIEFVCEYYSQISIYLQEISGYVKDSSDEIQLITRINYDWCAAIDTLPAEVVERILNWECFSVDVINVGLKAELNNSKPSGEILSVYFISRSWGNYIRKQYQKENLVNDKKWEKLISNGVGYNLSSSGLDVLYGNIVARRNFNVCYGYLLYGQVTLVKNAIFLEKLRKTQKINNSSIVLEVMLIHCYMYYLAFKERDDCIDEKLQLQIRAELLDKSVVESISIFYYRLSENAEVLSEQLEDTMEKILEPFELFPDYASAKTLIMEDVVKEYFLYIILLIDQHSYQKNLVSDLLSSYKYSPYLYESKLKQMRDSFIEMQPIFSTKEVNAYTQVDEMLSVFKTVMKVKHKNIIMDTAQESERYYEENNISSKVKSEIKKIIDEKFSTLFGNIYISKGIREVRKKIHVFTCNNFTRGIDENVEMIYSNEPFGSFVEWMKTELVRNFKVKIMDRESTFSSDEAFRDFLSEHDYSTFIGSQYVFGCVDFKKYEEHMDFLSERTCLFIPTSQVGIAVCDDILSVKLNEIMIEIHSPIDMDDFEVVRHEDSELLTYSPSVGLSLDFKEVEFVEYIRNEYKVIEVYFDITIGVKQDIKDEECVIITREI